VVEGAAVVVGDIAEQQSPADGDRRDILDDDGEPVAIRVVRSPGSDQWIVVTVDAVGRDIGIQRLGMHYGLPPLEPCAVE